MVTVHEELKEKLSQLSTLHARVSQLYEIGKDLVMAENHKQDSYNCFAEGEDLNVLFKLLPLNADGVLMTQEEINVLR